MGFPNTLLSFCDHKVWRAFSIKVPKHFHWPIATKTIPPSCSSPSLHLPLPLALLLALGIKSFMRKAFLGDGSLLASPSPGSINPCILSSFGRFLNHIGIILYSVFCIIFLYHIGIIPSPDSDFSLMSRSPSSLQKRQMHKDGNKEANQDLDSQHCQPAQWHLNKNTERRNWILRMDGVMIQSEHWIARACSEVPPLETLLLLLLYTITFSTTEHQTNQSLNAMYIMLSI